MLTLLRDVSMALGTPQPSSISPRDEFLVDGRNRLTIVQRRQSEFYGLLSMLAGPPVGLSATLFRDSAQTDDRSNPKTTPRPWPNSLALRLPSRLRTGRSISFQRFVGERTKQQLIHR